MLKHRLNFECIDPARIGHPRGTEIVLGKLSGRTGFAARARALGFDLGSEELAEAFRAFQEIADQKREVSDEDVRAICSP